MEPDTDEGQPPMMAAAQFEGYGPPTVLRVADVPRPRPGEGEVLVKVQTSSINGGELAKRNGKLKIVTGRRFPQPIGIDFVGVVERLGASVTDVQVGATVWGTVHERAGVGSQAEYVEVLAARVSRALRTSRRRTL